MEITEVRINPSKGGRVRAFASIVIDDCFIINDLRVMEGREGQLFVTMPARKIRNGQMRDIAHPLTSEARRNIEDSVLNEYRRAVENLVIGGGQPQKSDRKEQHLSPLARLAARLFSEDYWSTEEPQPRAERRPEKRTEKRPEKRTERRPEKRTERRPEKRAERGAKSHGRGPRGKRREESAAAAE